MNWETPLEITQLPGRLRQEFSGKLPEATIGTPEQREKNFLSRALAAFAIHRLSGCTVNEAAAAVVDGGGIDAIHYSPTSHRLLVVQAKFIEKWARRARARFGTDGLAGRANPKGSGRTDASQRAECYGDS